MQIDLKCITYFCTLFPNIFEWVIGYMSISTTTRCDDSTDVALQASSHYTAITNMKKSTGAAIFFLQATKKIFL